MTNPTLAQLATDDPATCDCGHAAVLMVFADDHRDPLCGDCAGFCVDLTTVLEAMDLHAETGKLTVVR